MEIKTIRIRFKNDGAIIERNEWLRKGKNEKDALHLIDGIYGLENAELVKIY